MAYVDQKQNRTVALGSVALVHIGMGTVLLTGLVVTSPTRENRTFEAVNIEAEPPLPEPTPPPPEPRADTPREAVTPPVHAPVRRVETPAETSFATTNVIFPPTPPLPPARVEAAPPTSPLPPAAPPVNLSRGLQPRGDQGSWFPQDSYPSAARRAGAEGRVSVTVDVGVNGRVIGCRVATSSGNEDLDRATCRLATRNGRFTPALNAAGEPVPGTLTLRPVRWTLEE